MKRMPKKRPKSTAAEIPLSERWRHPAIGIGVAALAVRTVHLFLYRADFWMRMPLLDDNLFVEWSEVIRQHGWLARSLGVFDLNPAYPYLLASLHRLGLWGATAIFTFQHLVGAGIPVVLYFLTDRILGRRTAVLAGVFAAFYGPAVFYEARYLGECWIYFCNAAMLLALAMAARAGRPPIGWGAAGLFLGLSATFRPNILALVPLALAWGAWVWKDSRRNLAPCAALFLLGVWLPLFPFQLRNRIVAPSFGWGLTTASGGVNLYLGNNPEADGLNSAPSFVRYGPSEEYRDFKREAERRTGRTLLPREISDYFLAQTAQWFRRHPRQALELLLRKAGFFWNYHEPPDNFFQSLFMQFTRLGPVPLLGWSLIAPLGLAGLLCVWSVKPRPPVGILAGYVLFYFSVNVAFYVLSRYRFPAALGLIPLAAWMSLQLVDAFRAQATRHVFVMGTVVGLCFGLSRLPLIGEPIPEVDHYSKGVIYANQGWKEKAVNEYHASIQANANFKPAYLNLGILEAGLGHAAAAAAALEHTEALESDPAQRAKLHAAVQNLKKLGG